jgi:hypothetical protein
MHAPARIKLLVGFALVLSCSGSDEEAKAPALVFETTGPAPQGGLVDFAVQSTDKDNPFGPAPRMVSGAIAIRYDDVSPSRIAGVALVDPLSPIGPLRLELTSRNARGEIVTFSSAADDPRAPLISLARAPLRLTPGNTEPNESIAAPRQSNLYKVAIPDEDQIFVLTFGTVGTALRTTSGPRLVGAVAPASGRFGDGLLFDTTFDSVAGSRVAAGLLRRGKGAGDAFIAIHASDLSGGPSEYNYTLKVALAKGTPFTMKEPAVADGPTAPLASVDVDGPVYAIDGAIDKADDADWVVFTPKRDGRVFVTATPVEAVGPLNVSIFGNDPGVANCTAFMAGGLGTTQAEVKATAGTTYCARVNSASRLAMAYQLVITPEL